MFRTRFGYVFYTLIAIITVILIYDSIRPVTKVEAQSTKRFQLQAIEIPSQGYSENSYLEAICDTATGNLIYKNTYGGYGTALAVIPNGCQKNFIR